jgi:hypothetical protein
MEGGSISNNTVSSYGSGGGGVYVTGEGTFTMKGGSIENNTASFGGGVVNDGTFTMENGSIEGNTASWSGGGVFVDSGGTFTMKGGAIRGNTASVSGGGVYLYLTAVINKTGGTIYGNDASADQANTVTGQTGKGAVVYVGFTGINLEKTVDAGHNLTKAQDDYNNFNFTPEKGWSE